MDNPRLLDEQQREEETDHYDSLEVPHAHGHVMLPLKEMRRSSVDHLRVAIQQHERRRGSEQLKDSDVVLPLPLSMSHHHRTHGSMDQIKVLSRQRSRPQDNTLLLKAAVKNQQEKKRLDSDHHPPTIAVTDSEPQQHDSTVDDKPSLLSSVSKESLAVDEPPLFNPAEAAPPLDMRGRHLSTASFGGDPNNLLEVAQRGRRGSVQVLKAFLELQEAGEEMSDNASMDNQMVAQPHDDVTSVRQQKKSRQHDTEKEIQASMPSLPFSLHGTVSLVAATGGVNVASRTNYRALEVISFISRHLQDGHTGHAREIKDMLKKEWKERRLAQGEGGFRDTPLTLAIRQNKPDVAEVIATYHVGDWEQEVSNTDTTALLFCLKNGVTWYPLALHMTRRMAEQMIRHKTRKTNAILAWLNMEPHSTKRSRDIIRYLSYQTGTVVGLATALHLAAYHGLEDIAVAIIDCGIGVDEAAGANFYTPLCFAIIGQQVSCVATLMKHGANPNMNISRGSVATLAVAIESVEIVQMLLIQSDVQRKSTVRSNRKQMLRTAVRLDKPHLIHLLAENCEVDDRDAVACFRYAMANRALNTARELVVSGAVLNATDANGNTPLIQAIRNKETELVKLLLSRNANTTAENTEGMSFWNYLLEQIQDESDLSDYFDRHTLLIKAAEMNDMAALTFLLADRRCDITKIDDNGDSIFHHAAKSGGSNLFALLEAASEKGRVYQHLLVALQYTDHELQQLIQKCINVLPKKNKAGKTALHLACETGLYVAVKYLARFTDINSQDNSGQTVLHCAAANLKAQQAEKILRWLLTHHAQHMQQMVHVPDVEGNTPLHIAVRRVNIAAVRVLAAANPPANLANMNGLSPFQSALFEQPESFFADFLDSIERNDPSQLYLYIFLDSSVNQMPLLHNLAKACQVNLIRLLIAKGANVLKKDKNGNTVLHHIARLISDTKHVSHSQDLLNTASVIIDEAASSRYHTEMYLKAITGGKTSAKASFDKMKIIFYLTRCVPNTAGQSVLTYAGDLGASEYIEWMLRPIAKDEGVKLADDKDVVCSAAYDVTFLTPQCMQWANYKNKGESSMPNHSSLLDAIFKSEKSHMGTRIFDIMPMTFLLQKFISVYQWFYTLIFMMHVGYMSALTYFSFLYLQVIPSNSTPPVLPPDLDNTINGNPNNNGAFLFWPIILLVLNFVSVKHLFKQYHLSVSIHERLLDEQLGSYLVRLIIVLGASLPIFLHFGLTLAWYFAVRQCDAEQEIPLKFTAFACGLILPIAACILYSNMREFRKKLKLTTLKMILIVTPLFCNAFLYLGISLAANDCDPHDTNVTIVMQRRYYGIFLLVPCVEMVFSMCLVTWCLIRAVILLTTSSYHIVRDIVNFALHNIYFLATFAFFIVILGWFITVENGTHDQIYFLAATLIVGWLMSIHFTHCFRSMHMFGQILKQSLYDDSVRFALMYGLVTAGFSCAISVLYYDFPEMLAEQPTPLDTMYQALKVTVGLGDLIDSSYDFGTTNYYSLRSWTGLKLIYIIYIVFSNIVLLNIMIAMVQRTYENMANQECVSWREWRYNNIMFVMRLPQRIRTLVEYLGSTNSVRSHVKSMAVSDEFTMLILFVNDADQRLY